MESLCPKGAFLIFPGSGYLTDEAHTDCVLRGGRCSVNKTLTDFLRTSFHCVISSGKQQRLSLS